MMNDELGGCAAGLPEDLPQAPQILQRSLIADAMALRAPRCRLCACEARELKAQEIKDNKDFNDIKDAHCQL